MTTSHFNIEVWTTHAQFVSLPHTCSLLTEGGVWGRDCVMATGNRSGGYDYDFVDKVPERLNCQICAKPFRDPHLVVCCGKHYCGSCLNDWFRKTLVLVGFNQENCPHCRAEGEKFSHVVHKGLKSEVNELNIYCPKRDKGCKWVGQLGNLEAH